MADTETMIDEPGSGLVAAEARDLEAIDVGPVMQEGYLALAYLEDDGPLAMLELGQLASRLSSASRNSPWWYADLLVYAAENYGDLWYQLVDDIGHTADQISELVYVGTLFAPTDRLIPAEDEPGLTFSQHGMFVALWEKDKKAAAKMMKAAAVGNWTSREIRQKVKEALNPAIEAREADLGDDEGDGPETSSKSATHTTFTFSITVAGEDADQASELIEEAGKAAARVLSDAGVGISSISNRVSGKVPVGLP